MKVLIIEDDRQKLDRVTSVLHHALPNGLSLTCSVTIAEGKELLEAEVFDLLILDVRVPLREREEPLDNAGILLLEELLLDNRYCRPKYIVGLSGVESLYATASATFHRHGWVLLQYSPTDSAWSEALEYFARHASAATPDSRGSTNAADVVILTALENPEFMALRQVFPELNGPRPLDSKTLVWEGSITTAKGSVKIAAGYSWQMGLTAASILAGRFLSSFNPKLLAMTGICAGYSDSVALGDVVAANQSWEWQGGKLAEDDGKTAFRPSPEPYRASQEILTALHAIQSSPTTLSELTRKYCVQDSGRAWEVKFGPMVSGSAVVASGQTMTEIRKQHRKVLALEMEAYAIYAAAELSPQQCNRIVLKGVCDFGDSHKDDSMQMAAALRSAISLRAILECGMAC